MRKKGCTMFRIISLSPAFCNFEAKINTFNLMFLEVWFFIRNSSPMFLACQHSLKFTTVTLFFMEYNNSFPWFSPLFHHFVRLKKKHNLKISSSINFSLARSQTLTRFFFLFPRTHNFSLGNVLAWSPLDYDTFQFSFENHRLEKRWPHVRTISRYHERTLAV